ncbi:Hypothetical predicted protein [Mytilus galloprovincialis]|uniref:Uncharacterized protein n=1 Tax=Mytilus galloprovincialis TaxID=29158 RepID=A0A8B6GPQ9_MYTGA|nr:Hypothetical predicted protein [Mytilus galloprovincialis]
MERYIVRHHQGCARAGEDEQPTGLVTPGKNTGPNKDYEFEQRKCVHLWESLQEPTWSEDTYGKDKMQAKSEHNNAQGSLPKRTSDTSKNNIRRKRVKWPNNKSKSKWQQFEEDVDAILNTKLAGNIDRKIELMTSFIYNIGMDRFGADEKAVVRREGQKNRRESKIAKMRKDLRQLKKRYNQASEDEEPALSEHRDTIRKNLMITRRAEINRKRRKKREKARAQLK